MKLDQYKAKALGVEHNRATIDFSFDDYHHDLQVEIQQRTIAHTRSMSLTGQSVYFSNDAMPW